MKQLHITFLVLLVLAVGIRIVLSFIFAPQLHNGQQLTFNTTLLTEPTDKGNYKTVTVSYTNGLGSVPVLLVLPADSDIHYGQSITISSTLIIKALHKNQKIYEFSRPQISVKSNQSRLFTFTYFLRQQVQKLYESVLPEKSAALLLGIVLGVKGNFPSNFLQDLQSTGVMHVIAASGMNVTMVAGFLLGVFTLFLRRQIAVIVTLSGVLFYCIISGLQASILRATIMILFVFSAQLFGRQYSSLYGLLLAAGGMLLYQPQWLTDIGFQLSFAATCGIFFLKPFLPKALGDDFGTTVAAQIATLPILVGSFGSYGLLSILVNILVLWTIPILMVLGGVGALIGLIFAPLGQILVYLSAPILWYFEAIVSYFGNLGWGISLNNLPWAMVAGYYFLLVSLIILRKERKPAK